MESSENAVMVDAIKTQAEIDALFETHADWAVVVTRSWMRGKRLPSWRFDEVVNTGLIALWECARRWKDMGFDFKILARRRINGALMDLVFPQKNALTFEPLEVAAFEGVAAKPEWEALALERLDARNEAIEQLGRYVFPMVETSPRRQRILAAMLDGASATDAAKAENISPSAVWRLFMELRQKRARAVAELN